MNAFPTALVVLCLLALSAYSESSFSAHQSAARGTAGMVSSTSTLGNEAAIEVMKSGAMRSMRRSRSDLRWRSYPEAGNIGGGGFAVVRLPSGEVVSLDHRERAPAAAYRDMFSMNLVKQMPSCLSIAI